MARGSKPGERRGGRKKGTPNQDTKIRRDIAVKAAAEGITPLELSLSVMRALWDQATDAAGNIVNMGKAMQAHIVGKDAAPYLHPKLSNIEASGPDGGPIPLERIERVVVDPKNGATTSDNTED